MSECTTIALVVAGGRGTRVGAGLPKQYLPLGGRSVLRHSIEAFLAHPDIDDVQVVIHADDRARYDAAVGGLFLPAPLIGGATRQTSVLAGLEGLEAQNPDQVLIHDAARPFVDSGIIDRALAALAEHSGAIAALPQTDSLKRGQDGRITDAVDRTGLWRAQTPQAFRYADILAAHRAAAGAEHTDDAAVAAAAGLEVTLVDGDEDNFKITSADDLVRAERLLGQRLGDVRVGTGFDVHRFVDGDHVMLCGVRIPHAAALAGHSDADVGLHAITDALLGAIGAGDIGDHFPPSDPQWRGAPSDLFLRHAGNAVAARGGMVAHVDVTLICERPKIGPHRDAMVRRIGEILTLPPARVSVKATTTERLGFLGRGEGIGAQAVATVRLPL